MKNPVSGTSAAASDAGNATMAAAAKNKLRYINGSMRRERVKTKAEPIAFQTIMPRFIPAPGLLTAPVLRAGLKLRRSRLMQSIPGPKRRPEPRPGWRKNDSARHRQCGASGRSADAHFAGERPRRPRPRHHPWAIHRRDWVDRRPRSDRAQPAGS